MISYKRMRVYHYLKKAIWKNGICGLCCIYWTALPSPILAPPYLPVPLVHQGTRAPPAPCTWLILLPRTPLPPGVTYLLPLCFCHPELVVAQEEGPHGFADLRLDAPVVDETQQLLLLVTLVGGGRQRFGQHETRAWALWPSGPTSQTLSAHAVNKQWWTQMSIVASYLKKQNPRKPPIAVINKWVRNTPL